MKVFSCLGAARIVAVQANVPAAFALILKDNEQIPCLKEHEQNLHCQEFNIFQFE